VKTPSAGRNQGSGHQGALLLHFLNGVHHIRHLRIGNAVERRIDIDFPGDRLAAPGEFLDLSRGAGAGT